MSTTSGRATKRTLTAFVTTLCASLVLAGCSASNTGAVSDTNADGEGLPAGASKDDYIAAFQDIEPITIYAQTAGPKGSATTKNIENYMASVEEWSGGVINFDIGYSNAVAQPVDVDDALNDGRLDLGQVMAVYEPSDYPVTNALVEVGILNDSSAVAGVLQSNAWSNEVAFSTPEFMQEWDDHGLVPLVPLFNSGANALFCSDPLTSVDDLRGASISTGGELEAAQVTALGGSPTSIAYNELFESLQRGVISCAVTTETVSILGGFLSEAPHVMLDPNAAFAVAPGSLAFSKSKWESLPLVAQQLFWDKLDIFIGQNITEKIWPNTAEADLVIQEAGGSFNEFDADASAALQEVNSGVLDKLKGSSVLDGETFVAIAEESSSEWTTTVTDLGFSQEIGYAGFAEWYAAESPDITPYLDTLVTEVFDSHRPE